jgi:uncharacterized RDD family membrane protein YckC
VTAGELSPLPSEARGHQGSPAGLVTRALAGVIDGLLTVVALIAAYLGFNAVRFVVHPAQYEPTVTSLTRGVAAALVVLLVYLTLAWSVTGRTYGDHVMGLRVVGKGGAKVGALAALVRAALCLAFPVGLLWCAGDRRRSVQDMLVGTSVVYDWRAHRPTS